jgi:hypothetical protein
MESKTSHESNKSGSSINVEKKIPPIDMQASSNFDTASFGLG